MVKTIYIFTITVPNDYPHLLSVSLYFQYKGEPCPARHLQQDEHLHAGDGEARHQGGQGEPGGGEGFQVGHFENRKHCLKIRSDPCFTFQGEDDPKASLVC